MEISLNFKTCCCNLRIFFLSRFSSTGTGNSQDCRGKERTIFYSNSTTSSRSRASRHLFANLHVRWLSHIFNRNACIYQTATRWDLPPLELLFDWLMMWCWFSFVCWFDFRFCFSYLTWETCELELASTIILVLQANRLTKCASHPKAWEQRSGRKTVWIFYYFNFE